MGRLARRDISVYQEDHPCAVEAREGGSQGKSRWWHVPDEETAMRLACDLMGDDTSRKDMTNFIDRISPIHRKD